VALRWGLPKRLPVVAVPALKRCSPPTPGQEGFPAAVKSTAEVQIQGRKMSRTELIPCSQYPKL